MAAVIHQGHVRGQPLGVAGLRAEKHQGFFSRRDRLSSGFKAVCGDEIPGIAPWRRGCGREVPPNDGLSQIVCSGVSIGRT